MTNLLLSELALCFLQLIIVHTPVKVYSLVRVCTKSTVYSLACQTSLRLALFVFSGHAVLLAEFETTRPVDTGEVNRST